MSWRIGIGVSFFLAVFFTVFCLIVSRAGAESPAPAATPNGIIGTIVELEGSASLTPPGSQAAVAVAVDAPIRLNDTVNTGPGSRVFILFIDNTQMTLSENTKVMIDDYVFDPDSDKNNRARYSVLEGAFQYVSGLIGHKANPDVKIETPVGSIGIRGTDFWAGPLDGGYDVAVNEGQVALRTDSGEAVVNKGEGTSAADRYHAPARAQAWPRERFLRAAGTVRLQRREWVRQRIMALQDRQKTLRRNFRNYLQTHRRNYREAPAGTRGRYPGRAAEEPRGGGMSAQGREPGARQPEARQRLEELRAKRQERHACLQAAETREARRDCLHQARQDGGDR